MTRHSAPPEAHRRCPRCHGVELGELATHGAPFCLRCGLTLYGQDLSTPTILHSDGKLARPIYPLLEWQWAPCQRCGLWEPVEIIEDEERHCPACQYRLNGHLVRASWLESSIKFEHETSAKGPDESWELGDRCVAPPSGWRGVYLVDSDPFDPLHDIGVWEDGCVNLVSLGREIQWEGVPPKVPIRYY